MLNGTGLEGGVFQESLKRYSTTTFVYMPHSAVVIPCESARPLRTREKGGDESDPPPKAGGHADTDSGRCVPRFYPAPWGRSRPHLSLREGSEKPPFPLALHRGGSVLAVKGSLRRFAPWTAPGRSERRAAYEGKGGSAERGIERGASA